MQERQLGKGEKLISAGTLTNDGGVQLGQCSLWIGLKALRQIPTIENNPAGIAFLSDSQHIGGEFAMNNARIDPLHGDRCPTSGQQEHQENQANGVRHDM